MPVTIVAAVARNGVIGSEGGLPWHLPEDLRRFKTLTMGGVLVMGRRTFDSIGRPLPGRETVVVTRRPDPIEGVMIAGSVETALATAAATGREVFVVGGAEIYRQTIDVAEVMELTELTADYPGDTYFPAFTTPPWQEVARTPGDGFDFVRYQR